MKSPLNTRDVLAAIFSAAFALAVIALAILEHENRACAISSADCTLLTTGADRGCTRSDAFSFIIKLHRAAPPSVLPWLAQPDRGFAE